MNKQDLLVASGHQAETIERRKKTGRRVRRDRRKGLTRSVGLELSPKGVYLAIVELQGESVPPKLITRHVPFDRNIDESAVWSVESLTEILANLSSEFQLSGQAVVAGIGGSPCVTRVVMGENEDVNNDVRELTERSRRYIGMGHGEKICCRSEARIDAKRKRTWVTVAEKTVVDAIAESVAASGMRLGRIEDTMAVLCRILGCQGLDDHEPVLVVSEESGRIDLGISFRGQLLLDYRPAMPDFAEDSEDTVHRHIKCLRRYLQAKLPDEGGELSRVYASGVDDEELAIHQNLDAEVGLRTERFPLANILDGFLTDGADIPNDPGMIAAIWMARHQESDREPKEVNDLMSTLRPKNEVPWFRLAMHSWPVCAAVLFVATLFVAAEYEHIETVSLQQQIDMLSSKRIEAQRLRFELENHFALEREVTLVASKLSKPQWTRVLWNSGAKLPQGVWLENVNIDRTSSVIVGTSFTDEAIYEYMGRLKNSDLFTRVTLESTTPTRIQSGPAFRFEISGEIKSSTVAENIALLGGGKTNG